jgi:hypothetical protein
MLTTAAAKQRQHAVIEDRRQIACSRAGKRWSWSKKRCTGIAHHFLVVKVLDICLCDTAGIATDRPLVYGKRQGITQPASASNTLRSRQIPVAMPKILQQSAGV